MLLILPLNWMNIRCIAVDDEPLAIEKMKYFIGKLPQLTLLATFSDASSAATFLYSNKVQLVFLDIQLDGSSGITLAESLSSNPQIIFTTAYHQYAIKAFELAATDYLLKPFTFDRFHQAVNKVIDYLNWQQNTSYPGHKNVDYLFVKSGYQLVKVILNEVLYIEGMGDFQCIFTLNAKIIASHSFIELERTLPDNFVRCQKSYIVNLPKIDSIENDRIKIGNKLIPIGETFKDSFYRKIKG